jgi:hypothetical protein
MNIKTREDGRGIAYDENGEAKAVLDLCSRCGEWVDPRVTEVGFAPSGKVVCRPCWPNIEDRGATMRELEVPSEYAMAELTDFAPGFQRRAKEWPDHYPLFGVYGTPGVGKSHLVWAIARTLHRARRFVTVVDCRKAQVDWMASQRRDEVVRRWSRAGLLVLDDITGGSMSPGWKATIEKVFDARKLENAPTLVVTMNTGKELEATFGRAFWSRLHQIKWFSFPANAPDRRKVKGKSEEIAETMRKAVINEND